MSKPVGPHTLAEWLALPQHSRVELIDGEFVEKGDPTLEHGVARLSTGRVNGQGASSGERSRCTSSKLSSRPSSCTATRSSKVRDSMPRSFYTRFATRAAACR